MENRRVVITGTGCISSVGHSTDALWDAVLTGKCGIGPITKFDATDFRSQIAGEVKNFKIGDYMPAKEARRLDPFCHYALASSIQAFDQAGLDMDREDPFRVGVYIGCGIGGIHTIEAQHSALLKSGPTRVSPFLVPMMISDMASGAVSLKLGAKGPNFSVISACATASHAIGEAFWTLKRGDTDVMVAGGTEACVSPFGIAGFCSMRALSERNDDPKTASRPFDANRDGFVIGEGAGVLVLETLEHARTRGAEILCELVGYAATADAHHITAPDPEAKSSSTAIRFALERAGVAADEVDYINAHGTSTPLNDKGETLAIKKALGEQAYKTAVSSTKALTGHALGAAGGLETIICAQSLVENMIPGTYNYETPDPDCDLDYVPNTSREQDVTVAVNLNFGFGGHNAALVLKKFST